MGPAGASVEAAGEAGGWGRTGGLGQTDLEWRASHLLSTERRQGRLSSREVPASAAWSEIALGRRCDGRGKARAVCSGRGTEELGVAR